MLFPQEIFDNILSYLMTPVPFKTGKTYYVSYLGFVGNPQLDKIEIDRVFTQDNETFINYKITSFMFITPSTMNWCSMRLEYVKRATLYNPYNMFYLRVNSSLPNPLPGALYSRNTTNEARAFEILLSRLDENSEWFSHIVNYCASQNIHLNIH